MAKKNRESLPSSSDSAEVVAPLLQEPEGLSESDDVPQHRRCPICWGTRRGKGTAYSKQGKTRYYKCKQGCGHTWTVTATTEITRIESRKVDLSER